MTRPLTVTLKPGRERSLERHHPWLYAGAVATVNGSPQAGDTVDVLSNDGRWLARGAYSPRSQLRLRLWTFNAEEPIDDAFFHARLARAIDARKTFADSENNGYRLVNGEADGLPGLIVDRYNDYLVCQFSASGVERWRQVIVEHLQQLSGCLGVYERSDLEVRRKEGLQPRSGLLGGAEPPPLIEIQEHDLHFLVDVYHGHKTGFYLDQRDARSLLLDGEQDRGRVRSRGLAQGAEVLNCFSYTGAFAIAALAGGARSVVNVDSSADVLALGRRQLALNGYGEADVSDVNDNVFGALRTYRNEQRQFDVIILDPPKFVDTRARLERACRGYKDINWLAFRLLRPGGVLLTFSCSGLLEPALFQKVVADAALDAGVDAQLLSRLGQATDHPTALAFPEGAYLKGLLCKI